MKRLLILAGSALLAGAPVAQAQVSVRAPFVRVQVGGPGVSVRVPFVSLYIPSNPPFYVGQPPVAQFGPAPSYIAAPPPTAVPAPAPAPQAIPKALPPLAPPLQAQAAPVPPQAVPTQPQPDFVPPTPAKIAVPTLAEFAKTFQPRPGNYEISLINPLTNQPTPVRFSLHAAPQNVRLGDNLIEFQFGPNQFVRVEFDRQGAFVVSR